MSFHKRFFSRVNYIIEGSVDCENSIIFRRHVKLGPKRGKKQLTMIKLRFAQLIYNSMAKKKRRKKCEHFFPCSIFSTAHKNGPWHEEYAPCYVTVVAQKFNRHHQHFKPRCALTAPAEACTVESYLFYLKTLSLHIYTHFITFSRCCCCCQCFFFFFSSVVATSFVIHLINKLQER